MTETELEQEEWIPLDEIQVPDERITSVHSPEILEEIYGSLDDIGQKDPVKCRVVDGVTILTDGLHRVMWARKKGLKKIRGVKIPGSMGDVLLDNWVFNRHRGKSDPVGEGLVLKTLMEEQGLTLREAADKCKTNKSTASRLVRIQSLDPYTLQHIRNGKLAVGAAFHLTQLEAGEERLQVVEDAIKWNYTIQQTKDRVAFLLNPQHIPAPLEHKFEPSGEPDIIYPLCFICDTELRHAEKITRLCVACFGVLEDQKRAIPAEPVSQVIAEHLPPSTAPAQVPSPSPPEPIPEPIQQPTTLSQPPQNPVPQPIIHNPDQTPNTSGRDQTPCPHPYVMFTTAGLGICRVCGANLGLLQP